ncbi:phage tail sheath family protein [Anabaena cylindrica FACHB-243]|uniref:Phage tail sheath protein n=1 Tax=Anabaena cylindrica (strain ATCC 27899 / PCC 7122) TaxID=272123 RepID=K9ZB49_ANACC|nr:MULTISPECIES: phage tail sheath C-terminal domain-containing protein [Anabaena]AFZ55812.1 phage tail sheath protein [Anabaena cylindrica PCC 7122]MBD2421235.1 phage tail sheath family protein [Anabaena cylindrica FACHB-243]MBY5284150.1 phage tail sheath family protein [Anabaena sp. CCAP 1446/1C]MBY5308066.1 phage tail sheath family protein [Anabaena sp. CCAP 1446/1C]MCM2406566.1 phage tail sheath subtilisin-like domain-containing protein [Anabaena sp. CCAP 1446/1C]
MPTYHTPGVYVEEVSSGLAPIAGVGTSTAGFIGIITLAAASTGVEAEIIPTPDGEVKLCTNFTEFKKYFGDFSTNSGQNILAHTVYGFFRNGGTRCFVTWIKEEVNLDTALDKFEAVDEIAIVVAPGITSKTALDKINTHCRNLGDRFAILDIEEDIPIDSEQLKPGSAKLLGNSDYAAVYYPWIQVFDPVSKGLIFVPPSGHIAGVYARVDDKRGVHKAPANEPILGAVGLKQDISKSKQAPLNEDGINCIRNLNGNIRIWGARTLGAGKDNPDFKYINIRRQFNYLRESIDEGTQWVVFEPNTPELWAKIRRNVTAFLTNEWRKGALFGTTVEEAFFVKCDAENNPMDTRKLGQVVTEIGVAVIEPAEFVIFRISQLVDEQK